MAGGSGGGGDADTLQAMSAQLRQVLLLQQALQAQLASQQEAQAQLVAVTARLAQVLERAEAREPVTVEETAAATSCAAG